MFLLTSLLPSRREYVLYAFKKILLKVPFFQDGRNLQQQYSRLLHFKALNSITGKKRRIPTLHTPQRDKKSLPGPGQSSPKGNPLDYTRQKGKTLSLGEEGPPSSSILLLQGKFFFLSWKEAAAVFTPERPRPKLPPTPTPASPFFLSLSLPPIPLLLFLSSPPIPP